MKHTLIALAVTTGFTHLCWAADPAPVPSGLLACEQIQDSAERVLCYDNQVAALKKAAKRATTPAKATTSTSTVSAPPPSASPSGSVIPQSPEAKFGQEDLPIARHPESAKQDRYLYSTLSSIKPVDPGMYLFTLDNGQVWKQSISNSDSAARFFRTGDDVRIEKTTLGAYQLAVPRLGTKNRVLVNRVK